MSKRLKLALAAAVLLVLFMSAQGTAALWRATGTIDAGTVTTGGLSLVAGNGAGSEQNYRFTALDTTTLKPGGFIQAPLTISNTGTVGLGYTLTGAHSATTAPGGADTALAAAVVLSMRAVTQAADCTAWTPQVGDVLFQKNLSSATFAQSRSLAAGASEILCVRVALPNNAPSAAAGGSLKLVLSWRGDQQ